MFAIELSELQLHLSLDPLFNNRYLHHSNTQNLLSLLRNAIGNYSEFRVLRIGIFIVITGRKRLKDYVLPAKDLMEIQKKLRIFACQNFLQ